MNSLTVTLILLCGVYDAAAGRRYIAIPVERIDVIEIEPSLGTTRNVRQTEEGYAATPSDRQDMSVKDIILDYVDFGGYTGSNGAFSWYADYPAHH